jgi:hypothetical protein
MYPCSGGNHELGKRQYVTQGWNAGCIDGVVSKKTAVRTKRQERTPFHHPLLGILGKSCE